LIPNLLSAFRLLLIPFILLALAQGLKVQALGLILLSVATDLVDGWVARRFGLITDLGKILDPLGDKLSTGALSLYLAWVGKLPWWIVGVVVG
jgi:phosphatidylglycerophosphate synthase